jgi:AcrR family transcriptional regulator
MPMFRRAKPRDALDMALATFVSGTRVDMGVLATQLAVSRATLYRWFGSREQLLEKVLERLSEEFSATARAEAVGEGDERVLDFARRIMEATIDFAPVRTFVAREPQLALRFLISEGGAVHRRLAQDLRAVIAGTYTAAEAEALEKQIDAIVNIGTALQWATLAIGDEPQTDRAIEIMRVLLATGRAGAA